MTADGAERLRQELAQLIETERPRLVAESENADAGSETGANRSAHLSTATKPSIRPA